MTSDARVLCKCRHGFRGLLCEQQVPVCESFRDYTKGLDGEFFALDQTEGSVSALFCEMRTATLYYLSVCHEDNGENVWSPVGVCIDVDDDDSVSYPVHPVNIVYTGIIMSILALFPVVQFVLR